MSRPRIGISPPTPTLRGSSTSSTASHAGPDLQLHRSRPGRTDPQLIVVAPTITSNFFAADGNWLGGSTMPAAAADLFLGDRPALVASAWAAAGHQVTLPQKVVIVGHSLGGGFATAMAGDMVDNGTDGDLAGVILLDGVAFDTTVPSTTIGKLPSDIPVLMIASTPYLWNVYGQTKDALAALRPGEFNGVQLVGGQHIDGLQGGNPLIQFAKVLRRGILAAPERRGCQDPGHRVGQRHAFMHRSRHRMQP